MLTMILSALWGPLRKHFVVISGQEVGWTQSCSFERTQKRSWSQEMWGRPERHWAYKWEWQGWEIWFTHRTALPVSASLPSLYLAWSRELTPQPPLPPLCHPEYLINKQHLSTPATARGSVEGSKLFVTSTFLNSPLSSSLIHMHIYMHVHKRVSTHIFVVVVVEAQREEWVMCWDPKEEVLGVISSAPRVLTKDPTAPLWFPYLNSFSHTPQVFKAWFTCKSPHGITL